MKKLLLMACVLFCCAGAGRAQTKNTDVPLDNWAYNAINKLSEAGLIEGRSPYTDARGITRYEFAVVIARILQNAQLDMELRAAQAYIPQKLITQQPEIVNVITKLAIEFAPELKMLGVGDLLEKFQSTLPASLQASKPKITVVPFPDVPKNHWAFAAVETLKRSGIVIGYPNATFSNTR